MFEIVLPRELIYGEGSLKEISKKVKGKRVFLVTATNIYLPFKQKIIEILKECNLSVYSEINSEPNVEMIDKGVFFCKQEKAEIVVGIGGGSVLDAGKAISLLQGNSGSIRDYQMGERSIENRGVPYIAIPTTAGTGSEATKVVVVTNKEERMKKSIAHPFLVPSLVILDPNLTISLPPEITASTGIDALSHCLESYVSLNANPFTEAISLKGMELIGKNLERAYLNGKDLDARSNMLLGSYLGGMALNAGVGIGHILAQPISAICGLSHGEAIGLTISQVMKVNLDYSLNKYSLVASSLVEKLEGLSLKGKAEKNIEAVVELLEKVGMKKSLKDYSIKENSFPDILESVRKSTTHIQTNPRPVDEKLLKEILKMSLKN